MKKIYLASFLSLITYLLFLVSTPMANADTTCQPIYGGGQSCVTTNNIVLDKKVQNPETNVMVDNLSINDPKYQPESIVTFQISVTNSSNKTISNINVKDIFPQFIEFNSGIGNFDANTRTLSFGVQDLMPNETRVFTIEGKVVNTELISINQGTVICVVNQTNATSDNNNFSQDNSQFCIEKGTIETEIVVKGGFPILSPVPVTTSPSTGAESLVLFSLLPTGIAGFILRKISLKNRKEKN